MTGGVLAGRRVVVTAGGTREPIDPVRYIGNRSSGKMGNALAAAAADAGAEVRLITAAAPPAPHDGVTVEQVETAEQMRDAVWRALESGDLLVMAAAVADYRPETAAPRKLKKSPEGMTLRLVPTVDILRSLRDHPRSGAFTVVGFAAETDDLVANAEAKLHAKGLDLIVLNDVAAPGIGMGTDDNEVTVLDSTGIIATVERSSKDEVARRLVELIASRLGAAARD